VRRREPVCVSRNGPVSPAPLALACPASDERARTLAQIRAIIRCLSMGTGTTLFLSPSHSLSPSRTPSLRGGGRGGEGTTEGVRGSTQGH
jgi:hypothetical protein